MKTHNELMEEMGDRPDDVAERYISLERENDTLRELLRVAVCPYCDGSGSRLVETGGCGPEGENDTRDGYFERCQWCDHRTAMTGGE